MKTLLKWLMPSSEKIADLAADAFQKVINDKLADNRECIVKASLVSERMLEVQKFLTDALADGTMSDEEKAALSRALKPLVQTVIEKL